MIQPRRTETGERAEADTAPMPDLPSFKLVGSRYRINLVSFLPEDAMFLSAEAARDDCSVPDVLRRAVREYRRVRGKAAS